MWCPPELPPYSRLSDEENDGAVELPVIGADLQATDARPSPLASAGLLSRLTFAWLSPLLDTGATRQLGPSDVPPLRAEDRCDALEARFLACWAAAAPGPRRLARALLSMEAPVLRRGFVAKLVHDTVLFASPAALVCVCVFLKGVCGADRAALSCPVERGARGAPAGGATVPLCWCAGGGAHPPANRRTRCCST